VARFKDIVAGIQAQTTRRQADIAKTQEALNRLLEPYQRFRELSAQAVELQESARIGGALVVNAPLKMNVKVDAFDPRYRDELQHIEEGEPVDLDDFDLSNFPLWKVMREVLRQVPEIRVYELEAHLKMFGVKASRSALESALKTHPRQFRLTKRGREKFVSLK
jgi:hypothetical protein